MIEIVGKFLAVKGLSVAIVHSGLSATERNNVMERFRNGEQIMAVATNVLARGVDIPNVRVVINFEMPSFPKSINIDAKRYFYRMGRSTRFGKH